MKKIIFMLIGLLSYTVFASCSTSDISCNPIGEGSNCTFSSVNIQDCPDLCGHVTLGEDALFSCNISGICYQVEVVPFLIYTIKCDIYETMLSPCINNTIIERSGYGEYTGLLNFNPIMQYSFTLVKDNRYPCISIGGEGYGFGSGEDQFNQAFILFLQLLMLIFLMLVLYGFGYSTNKRRIKRG
jgi:hypothetical protein